jgi:hypothetical protein
MTKNRKMEIQTIVEEILTKHNIHYTDDQYVYLKLSMPHYLDLVIVLGNSILVGHYRELNDDLVSDPVLNMERNKIWSPIQIQQGCGDTTCVFYEDGKRMISPDAMKDFMEFQKFVAQSIRENGWLENGVIVKTETSPFIYYNSSH